jgi:phospholipase C
MTTLGELMPLDRSGLASFGSSSALSADGNVAVIGGMSDNNGAGAVWTFARGGSTWAQQGTKLAVSGDAGARLFGASVALSWDGSTLLVGGYGANNFSGAAWLYTLGADGTWQLQAKWTGDPASAWFGVSVALSWDGEVALVGASGGPNGAGAAWVFTKDKDGVWTQGPKLTAGSLSAVKDGFGRSVALSADGDVALIGASGIGSVAGAAWVFTQGDSGWNPLGTLLPAQSDRGGNTGLGYSVALSADGGVALIGSFGSSDGSQNGAWVYTDQNGNWQQQGPRLTVTGGYAPGWSVALSADGATALLGDWDQSTGGVAWEFANKNGAWQQQGPKIHGGATSGFDGFGIGYSVAMSADGYTLLTAGYDQSVDGPGWTFDDNDEQITHIFVLMLENHSFDNMLGLSGIGGITTRAPGNSNTYNGTNYPVAKPALPSMPTDPAHEFADAMEQLCGSVRQQQWQNGTPYPAIDSSGFASNYATSRTEIHSGNPRLPTADEVGEVMKCFDTPTQLPVMYQLATEFAVCDHWFSSLPGPTMPNRFFLHGGSSSGLADSPADWQPKAWVLHGFAHANGNIFGAMKKVGVNWRIYVDTPSSLDGWLPPPVCLLKGVQYVLNTSPFSKFAADLQRPTYPQGYTFIEPNYGDVVSESFKGGSSQHPMDGVYGGEMLIKQTYEAIRASPHWNTSLLIITYDEHGGFFDSLPPIPAPPPNDRADYTAATHFDFALYGVRVPAIVISPLIEKGKVDSTVYDHTSVLATLEKTFNVPPLTDRDRKAADLKHLLTLATPRTDCPTTLNNPAPPPPGPSARQAAIMAKALDHRPLPSSGNAQAFLAVLAKTDHELSKRKAAATKRISRRLDTIQTRGDARAYARHVARKARKAKAQREKTSVRAA